MLTPVKRPVCVAKDSRGIFKIHRRYQPGGLGLTAVLLEHSTYTRTQLAFPEATH